MTKHPQLQQSGITYLTCQGGGAGCAEDGECSVSASCWAKGLAGGRLARLPQYQGLTRVWDRPDPTSIREDDDTYSRRVRTVEWTGKVWEDPDFSAKFSARKVPSVVGFWFMGDCAFASEQFLRRSFEAFAANPQHQIIVLTKRWPMLWDKLGLFIHNGTVYIHRSDEGFERTNEGGYSTDFLTNVWVGVSATDQVTYNKRVSELCDPETGWPGNTFVSIEPCMGPINMMGWLGEWPHGTKISALGTRTILMEPEKIVRGPQWVIAGSANSLRNGAAAFTPEIARSLHDQCREAGVPFWLKQAAWSQFPAGASPAAYNLGRVEAAPFLQGLQHLEAPVPIAAILRERGKL